MNNCKRRAVFALGFTAFVLCTPTWAQNSKLNAPVSHQPTVGSEIKRGAAAGNACDSVSANVLDATKFAECISAAINANVQQSTLSEPYVFGLYIEALSASSIRIKVLNITNKTKGHNGLILKWRKVWHDQITKIMESNNLSFKDFCEAIRSVGDNPKCEPTIVSFFAEPW